MHAEVGVVGHVASKPVHMIPAAQAAPVPAARNAKRKWDDAKRLLFYEELKKRSGNVTSTIKYLAMVYPETFSGLTDSTVRGWFRPTKDVIPVKPPVPINVPDVPGIPRDQANQEAAAAIDLTIVTEDLLVDTSDSPTDFTEPSSVTVAAGTAGPAGGTGGSGPSNNVAASGSSDKANKAGPSNTVGSGETSGPSVVSAAASSIAVGPLRKGMVLSLSTNSSAGLAGRK